MVVKAVSQHLDRRADIADRIIRIRLAEIAKGLIELSLDIRIELYTGLDSPKKIGCNRQIARLGPNIAFLTNARVHTEDFLNHDHPSLGGGE